LLGQLTCENSSPNLAFCLSSSKRKPIDQNKTKQIKRKRIKQRKIINLKENLTTQNKRDIMQQKDLYNDNENGLTIINFQNPREFYYA